MKVRVGSIEARKQKIHSQRLYLACSSHNTWPMQYTHNGGSEPTLVFRLLQPQHLANAIHPQWRFYFHPLGDENLCRRSEEGIAA